MLQQFCDLTRDRLIWQFPPALILFAAVWFSVGVGLTISVHSLRLGGAIRRIRNAQTGESSEASDGNGDQ